MHSLEKSPKCVRAASNSLTQPNAQCMLVTAGSGSEPSPCRALAGALGAVLGAVGRAAGQEAAAHPAGHVAHHLGRGRRPAPQHPHSRRPARGCSHPLLPEQPSDSCCPQALACRPPPDPGPPFSPGRCIAPGCGGALAICAMGALAILPWHAHLAQRAHAVTVKSPDRRLTAANSQAYRQGEFRSCTDASSRH